VFSYLISSLTPKVRPWADYPAKLGKIVWQSTADLSVYAFARLLVLMRLA